VTRDEHLAAGLRHLQTAENNHRLYGGGAGILAIGHLLAALVAPPVEYDREQPGPGPVPATVLGWPVGGREVAS